MVVIGQMGVDRQGRGDFGVTHETRKLQRRNPGGDTQTGVVQWSSRYSERSSRRTAPARIDTDQNFEAIDRRGSTPVPIHSRDECGQRQFRQCPRRQRPDSNVLDDNADIVPELERAKYQRSERPVAMAVVVAPPVARADYYGRGRCGLHDRHAAGCRRVRVLEQMVSLFAWVVLSSPTYPIVRQSIRNIPGRLRPC